MDVNKNCRGAFMKYIKSVLVIMAISVLLFCTAACGMEYKVTGESYFDTMLNAADRYNYNSFTEYLDAIKIEMDDKREYSYSQGGKGNMRITVLGNYTENGSPLTK
jgi:hypothetical protein